MPDPTSHSANRISPKLETVARAVGVSVSTVSRALRNNPQISAATRQRVQDAAKEMGYYANPYISTLMSHVRRTRPMPYQATIAWIDRLPANEWKANPVQAQFYAGAEERAQSMGFQIERLHCVDPALNRSRLSSILHSRGINGVLCSADLPEPSLKEFPFDVETFAVATVGCRFTKPDLHFSTNDQFMTARLAHQRLIELGYRRVGFVTTRGLEDVVDHRFTGGFLSALSSRVNRSDVPVHYVDDQGEDSFSEWLHDHRPDAVISAFMIELLDKILSMGLRVPEDVGFAVLDWDPRQSHISGIRQNHRRVGAGAVDVLVSQINRNEFGVPENAQGILIEGEWVDGATAPPR